MRSNRYYMVSFSSTHHAMRAEQFLKARAPVCTMPTLRAVTNSCGISLRVEEDEAPALKSALTDGFPVPREYYRVFYVTDSVPTEISIKGLMNKEER